MDEKERREGNPNDAVDAYYQAVITLANVEKAYSEAFLLHKMRDDKTTDKMADHMANVEYGVLRARMQALVEIARRKLDASQPSAEADTGAEDR